MKNTLLITFILLTIRSFSQQCPEAISLGPDTTLTCFGDELILQAPIGFDSYRWNNGSTADTLLVQQAGVYNCTVVRKNPNLILNGDFSLGNVGFRSDYNYIHGIEFIRGEQVYFVSSSNSNVGQMVRDTCYDHTFGDESGNMLIVVGTSNNGVKFWKQNVNVEPNVDYIFSFWYSGLSISREPRIIVFADSDTLISRINANTTTCNWVQNSVTINSGNRTNIEFSFEVKDWNMYTERFGIDDISLTSECVYTAEKIVAIPPEIDLTLNEELAPCGRAGISALHISQQPDITYQWMPGNYTGTTYQVTQQDTIQVTLFASNAFGCTDSITQNVFIGAPIVIQDLLDTTLCHGMQTPASFFQSNYPTVIYHWENDQPSIGMPVQGVGQLPIINVQNTGNTPITATLSLTPEHGGCVLPMQSIQITVLPQPNYEMTLSDTLVCINGNAPLFTLHGTVGLAPFQFEYFLNNGPVQNMQTNSRGEFQLPVSTLNTGELEYTVLSILDAKGCKKDSVSIRRITVLDTPEISFIVQQMGDCVPVEVQLINTSPTQGQNCNWTVTGLPTISDCGSRTIAITRPGNYDVQFQMESISGSCFNTQLQVNSIQVDEKPIAYFEYSPQELTVLSDFVQFYNMSQGASTFIWNFGNGNTSTDIHPVQNLGDSLEEYNVQLLAYSSKGCVDSIRQNIRYGKDFDLYIPNAFTPNDDGLNEVFIPYFPAGLDDQEYHFVVYNRWGELVFETNDPLTGWDGTYNGIKSPDGWYAWHIRVKKYLGKNGAREEFNGSVNLMR